MNTQKVFEQVLANIETVIKQNSPLGILLWQEFLKIHPADTAQFLGEHGRYIAHRLFVHLPQHVKIQVFSYLSDSMKVYTLSFLNQHDRSHLLASLPLDELTDFLDNLSDEELKSYLKLLHRKDREKVLSLMQFNPESAGGIMDTDVLTFMPDFTIEKSISILQRLQPDRSLHRVIYVTTQDQELLGHINLEDLVLKHPKTRLSSILRKNELVVHAQDDREKVVQQMLHYKVMMVPVISETNEFLGIIATDTVVDVLEKEAAEDVYRISALNPIKGTYFETPFLTLFYQRASILVTLLLIQTFSTIIIQQYELLLAGLLISFISMIASTGGNTSSQTSALVIQGMVAGEINDSNMNRFLRREFLMAGMIGLVLALVSSLRIFITNPASPLENFAVSISLGIIVIVSVMLGSLIPVILKKFNLDPALSAGPFLATLMDVLGILIFCFVSQLILG